VEVDLLNAILLNQRGRYDMNHPIFKIGQRVYYHYPPSGGDRKWYGIVTDYVYEWNNWEYTIKFDEISTPQKYANTQETTLIYSEEPVSPPEPSWKI
jgi:hypothetical protein